METAHKRVVVLDVVGLVPAFVQAEQMPWLSRWADQGRWAPIVPPIPAVTTTVQSTYLTGKTPAEHGIVANGWLFRDEQEIKLWRQSNHLVQAPAFWETLKQQDPSFTVAHLFWWYAMYAPADYILTPRPQYRADGQKIPDFYAWPSALHDSLEQDLGPFPLFDFWGPRTSIKSTRWIAQAAQWVEQKHQPSLSLVYLPHLDYNTQRHGPESPQVAADLRQLDSLLQEIIPWFEARGLDVVVLSEYGIGPVTQAVHINRVLRSAGYVEVRKENGLEMPDVGTCRAFALADHQIAHVYIPQAADIPAVKKLLQGVPGIASVWDRDEQKAQGLAHDRSGELVCLAESHAWFTYYYWLDDAVAPDFARMVDIHKKPGYDPVELFLNPEIRFPLLSVGWRLLKKKLGFRTVMDVIPLDASLVKGSHGTLPQKAEDGPLILSKRHELIPQGRVSATQVHQILRAHLGRG